MLDYLINFFVEPFNGLTITQFLGALGVAGLALAVGYVALIGLVMVMP